MNSGRDLVILDPPVLGQKHSGSAPDLVTTVPVHLEESIRDMVFWHAPGLEGRHFRGLALVE